MNREPGGYDPNTSNQPLQPASRVAAPSALFWFWMASGSTVAAAPAGVIVATTPGVSAIGALIAVLLGSLLAGLVLAAVSMAGVRTGSATLVLSDGVFGRRGNRVPLTVSFLVLMGWCAVMSVLLAAESHGLGALFFGLFDHERPLLDVLGVPDGRRVVGSIALGWPAPTGC